MVCLLRRRQVEGSVGRLRPGHLDQLAPAAPPSLPTEHAPRQESRPSHVQFQLSFLDLHTDFSEAGKLVWYSHLFKNFPQFVVIHTVKVFSMVNKAEVDVFLELSCFFCDPKDVGNLISSSSAFSKSSLNIQKLSVHVLLKPHLENFEHYYANV